MRRTAWVFIVSGIGLTVAPTAHTAERLETTKREQTGQQVQTSSIATAPVGSSIDRIRANQAGVGRVPTLQRERLDLPARESTKVIRNNVLQDRKTNRTVAPVAPALPRGNTMIRRLDTRRPDGFQRPAGIVGRVAPVAPIEKPAPVDIDSTR